MVLVVVVEHQQLVQMGLTQMAVLVVLAEQQVFQVHQ